MGVGCYGGRRKGFGRPDGAFPFPQKMVSGNLVPVDPGGSSEGLDAGLVGCAVGGVVEALGGPSTGTGGGVGGEARGVDRHARGESAGRDGLFVGQQALRTEVGLPLGAEDHQGFGGELVGPRRVAGEPALVGGELEDALQAFELRERERD